MGVLVLIGATLLTLTAGQGVSTASGARTVEVSGRAFIFNHMNTGISNATIKVREFPRLSATTDERGDYTLRVPNNATITPYIVSGQGELARRTIDGELTGTTMNAHWNEIDLQTFHTRGQNIENANFQAPRDEEYNALKAILQVPAREDGRPEQCAIVTTSSARNVRDVDFRTYWINTPHGVEGATSRAFPALPAPTYFNHLVIPDPSQPHSSNDGGIIWPIVPAGTYRIVTSHPTVRFASFLATCEPGRIVNANPPMGAYELNPGEKPRTFSNVAAKVGAARAVRTGKRTRQVRVNLRSGETVAATIRFNAGGRTVGLRRRNIKAGSSQVRIPIRPGVRARRGVVRVDLRDASGVSFTTVKRIRLPRVAQQMRNKRR